MKDSIKPVITIGRTNALIADQDYTYNESGFTYNQAGVQYGGRYEHDIVPQIAKSRQSKPISLTKTVKPKMTVGRTNALVENQGYTYNEAGFTYNQAGVTYGGIYEHDISPMIVSVRQIQPRIVIGGDFGATVVPTPPTPGDNSGMLIGMLGLLYT